MNDLPRTERTLRGGPLDGERRSTCNVARYTEYAVECPWEGGFWHLATARYRRGGDWVETRCHSTDSDAPLVEGANG